ncbi:spore germination protein [Paenibacillus swuensis]|uniref:spore germination protein n=1 Tax=Paenibacillus swuensis TaxID=1178515 RepID=UPI000837F6EB|nr:spore germination protein [Paenibacillus swuensis]
MGLKSVFTKESIQSQLKDIEDAKFEDITVFKRKAVLIYIKSLQDYANLQLLVIKPLQDSTDTRSVEDALPFSQIVNDNDLSSLIRDILNGYTVLLMEQSDEIYKINTMKTSQRSIAPSENEGTVLGPQDAFTESLETNLSQIKKRIVNPYLKSPGLRIGTESGTEVAVMYLEHIANPSLVSKVLSRLKHVEHPGLLSASQLNSLLEDHPFSPFPQLGLTQRPDNVTQALLNGKVCILMNGSPEVIICPITFYELFISPEDWYIRWTGGTAIRLLRVFGFFISIMLTSMYVSINTFHQEMLPPELLQLLLESRSKVPFSPLIEVLCIELVIEILREAGARMPAKIGQTIGVVGGIVIGTAAVEAGLASNVLIVLVSISALLSFLPANYLLSTAGRLVRYAFIFGAGMFGLFGQMMVLAFLLSHLLKLTSMGHVYISTPMTSEQTDWRTSIYRAPILQWLKQSAAAKAGNRVKRPMDEE